jgi:hypothetical protein
MRTHIAPHHPLKFTDGRAQFRTFSVDLFVCSQMRCTCLVAAETPFAATEDRECRVHTLNHAGGSVHEGKYGSENVEGTGGCAVPPLTTDRPIFLLSCVIIVLSI